MHNQAWNQVDQDRRSNREVVLWNHLWDYKKVVKQSRNKGKRQDQGERKSEAAVKVYCGDDQNRSSLQPQNRREEELE